ncbi:protein FAM234B [Syngnathoides biaculeatus]|uniref:protein FAM234B n=1 Tax=Syngnathoides biaculeatus TaxID=300417 RepID=UPI002ADE66EF|nr:protein FAM234B [Syngnathoides biaculeatus]
MAAALSRALKLPGKKGSELGEYDPLTQADSEDESEEDDLVLNYPRNGLGRDTFHGGGSGSTKLRAGRSGRLVATGDEAQEDDDEWRERLPSKSRHERDDVKGGQYWSPLREDGDQLGGSGLRVHGTDEEEKRVRRKNAVRTSLFMVPLVCAMLLVLLCAFLIPCEKGALVKRPQWEKALRHAGGLTPPALVLWDVDGDSVDDVLLSVTEWSNDTHPTQVYSTVVLSGASGQLVWKKVMWESIMYIQCGLQLSSKPLPVCLLIGKSIIVAVNGTTGKNLWSVMLKNIESQAVLLPDLQGDSVPDLLIATLPADQALDLSLTLISGLTGATLGLSVSFNLTGQGKLIGPLLHETQQGTPYILFGLGNVVAISLRDLYIRATSKLPMTPTLRRKDPLWEGLKKTNSSSFIHIFRGSERVTFLLPLVAGFGTGHNNLDTVSNMNSSKSDWLLVYGFSKISVLRHRDLRKQWTFNSAPIHRQPTPGHFNNDRILDLFFQHSANGIMTAQVIDGANGRPLWTAQFVCPRLLLETAAVSTWTGLSAFVFWASEPITGQKNITKATVVPGFVAAEPVIRKLFLLHPAYPTVLLELASTTDTAVAAAVSYEERQKDASYITVSSRPTPDSEPAAHIVKNMRLRAAIAKGQMVTLGERNNTGTALKHDMFELDEFYRHLFFKRQ